MRPASAASREQAARRRVVSGFQQLVEQRSNGSVSFVERLVARAAKHWNDRAGRASLAAIGEEEWDVS